MRPLARAHWGYVYRLSVPQNCAQIRRYVQHRTKTRVVPMPLSLIHTRTFTHIPHTRAQTHIHTHTTYTHIHAHTTYTHERPRTFTSTTSQLLFTRSFTRSPFCLGRKRVNTDLVCKGPDKLGKSPFTRFLLRVYNLSD